MTKGKDSVSTKQALQIFAWLIENGVVKDIRASAFQNELNLDRRILRRYFDCFVEAEVATVRTQGLTNIYALTIKLPTGKSAGSKEQNKAQKALEGRVLQEKLRYTQSPNEPTWIILPKFYAELKEHPDLVKEEDIFNPEANYEYLAGVCSECKNTYTADEFDKQLWKCRECARKWLGDSVFRADSEGELVE